MRPLKVDQHLFLSGFSRDRDYHDAYRRHCYLNLSRGEIVWVYDSDDEARIEAGNFVGDSNGVMRDQISADPANYLCVPGLSHGQQHAILQEFLESPWTNDEQLHNQVLSAYPKSIGGWLKNMQRDDAVIAKWYEYRDLRILDLAEAVLQKHGIEPQWC